MLKLHSSKRVYFYAPGENSVGSLDLVYPGHFPNNLFNIFHFSVLSVCLYETPFNQMLDFFFPNPLNFFLKSKDLSFCLLCSTLWETFSVSPPNSSPELPVSALRWRAFPSLSYSLKNPFFMASCSCF
jgi:hypothetical protein